MHVTFPIDNFQIFLQRSTNNDTKVFWTTDQARDFCIQYMNESAGYKACLGVPNVKPEHAITDCIADIQVSYTRFCCVLLLQLYFI